MGWLSRGLGWSSRRTGWQRAAIFRGLGRRELKWVAKHVMTRSAQEGERVVEEGARADELIVVDSGSLALVKRDPVTGLEHAIGTVGPGEVLSDYAVLDAKPRAASARATMASRLVVLSMETLRGDPAKNRGSIEQRVYRELVNGLTESLTLRARADVDRALEHARKQAMMGQFVVNVLILLCAYVLFLNALPLFWGRISDTTETFSFPVIALFGLASWQFIRKSGYPLSHFGIGTKHLVGSLLEACLLTPPFLAVLTAIKALVLWLSESAYPLFEHPDVARRLAEPDVVLWLRIYAATALIQELIVRGALQSSLEAFLTGPGRRTRAITVCALLFAISHLHISYLFAVLALVPGLFWGWLYSRRPNLVGVSLSHLAAGGYLFFILGIHI